MPRSIKQRGPTRRRRRPGVAVVLVDLISLPTRIVAGRNGAEMFPAFYAPRYAPSRSPRWPIVRLNAPEIFISHAPTPEDRIGGCLTYDNRRGREQEVAATRNAAASFLATYLDACNSTSC